MTILPYLRLIRPPNSLMIGLAVWVGEAVASSRLPLDAATIFGYLTGFFITAYSMVINDIFDIEVDRANQSSRPLATGSVSVNRARVFAVLLLLVGLLFSLFTGLGTFAIAAAFASLSAIYNWKLKESGLPGNAAVALSMTIPFIYGGLLVGRVFDPILDAMALTAFFAGVGREVVKGITDVEGDALRNVKTVARTNGPKAASMLGGLLFILAVVTSLVPVILGAVGTVYKLVIGATDILFLALAVLIARDCSRSSARRVKTGALFGMFLGLVGFILQGLLG
jgi:geranylgeranylglycerol-phosphate geranylgeranyltransferase